MNIWHYIVVLFIGWLFGLLSPVIVDEIRRRRSSKKAKSAIFTELTEIRLKLAFTAYTLAKSFGNWDREFLEWFSSITEIYSGSYEDLKTPNHIKDLLALSDDELEDIAKGRM